MEAKFRGKTIAEEMGARRTGVRISPIKKNSEKMSTKEKIKMAQVIGCAVIFVFLVATKLNMPSQFQAVKDCVSGCLYNSSDYKSAFAVIGRAVSGEKTAGETMSDLYTAVFAPESEAEVVETAATADSRQGNLSPLLAVSPYWQTMQTKEHSEDAEYKAVAASAEEENDLATSAVYNVEELPDDVCMEQKILNISYTTPIKGTLSSAFGYREHPIEGEEKFHYGIDIAANTGTAIGAFADGTVYAAGESTSLGKYIILNHQNGVTTLYAHCSKICASSGATVKKGGKIAEVGETGLATGPHCHFQIELNGIYLNPIYYVSIS